MYNQISQLQSNLNQVAQICNQISQAEQTNASRLQQAAHLCQQTLSQMSQFASTVQTGSTGNYYSSPYYSSPWTGNFQGATSSWAAIPVNTNQFAHTTGQYVGTTSY